MSQAVEVGEPTRLTTAIFAGKQRPDEAKFQPVTNGQHPWYKPRGGGLWTSPAHPTNGSHWVNWCVEEARSDGPFTLWELTIRPDVKVVVIDTLDDLARLHAEFGIEGGVLNALDFERMAKVYDGMHLTDDGQWATRMSHPIHLYGWDCESTLWFRWVFDDVRGPIEFTPPERND